MSQYTQNRPAQVVSTNPGGGKRQNTAKPQLVDRG